MSIKMMKQQWVPFFKKNKHIKRLVIDGDKCHPGNGEKQSRKACEFFNSNFPNIELLAGPNIWDSDGNKLTGNKLQSATARRKVTSRGTTTGHTWIANSPDLNVAEHAVAGIVDKTKIAFGTYTLPRLTRLIKKQWGGYSQDSLDSR